MDVESLVSELRLRLIERMEYWKAEGHRYSAEQEAHLEAHMKEIDAGWLRIDSKRLEGAKLMDCLRDAYDHHARILMKGGGLTEEALNQENSWFSIPGRDSLQMDSLSADSTSRETCCREFLGELV